MQSSEEKWGKKEEKRTFAVRLYPEGNLRPLGAKRVNSGAFGRAQWLVNRLRT